MKKVLIALLVLVLVLFGGISWLLFSQSGNNTIKNYLEARLNKELPIPVKITSFRISPMQIKVLLGKDSLIDVHGAFDVWKQAMNLQYNIDIKDLASLKPLTKQDLRGPLATHGTIKGNKEKLLIDGVTDVAASKSDYHVVLEDFSPKSVNANVAGAKLAKLLYMVKQPHLADGDIYAKVRLTDLEHPTGTIDAVAKNGHTDAKTLYKLYQIPKGNITFTLTAQSKLHNADTLSNVHLVSNVAEAKVQNAKFNTETGALDVHYNIKVADLAKLKFLTKQQFNGHVATQGRAKGDLKLLHIDGSSDLAGSKTTYHVTLKDFSPQGVQATVAAAKLGTLLYMLNQPHYADGIIDANVKIASLSPLNGRVTAKVRNGRTDAKVLKKQFGLDSARITFTLDDATSITKGVAISDIALLSSVANLHSKGARFDINKAALDAKYRLDIPDLGKLYFATKQKMRGKLSVTGEAKMDKGLTFTAHSDTLGGKVDAKLVNNNFNADVTGIEVVQLTHMLYYPKVFDSKMNAKLRYNVATKKGTLDANAINGRILPNQMTFLLAQMARFDITREIYKNTTLHSDIDNKKIYSDLDMQSRLTHITSKRAFMDLERNLIDAKLRIDIKNKPIYVKLKGNIRSPKVSLDAKGLLKEKVKEKLQKKLGNKLKNKLPNQVKGLLNLF